MIIYIYIYSIQLDHLRVKVDAVSSLLTAYVES